MATARARRSGHGQGPALVSLEEFAEGAAVPQGRLAGQGLVGRYGRFGHLHLSVVRNALRRVTRFGKSFPVRVGVLRGPGLFFLDQSDQARYGRNPRLPSPATIPRPQTVMAEA